MQRDKTQINMSPESLDFERFKSVIWAIPAARAIRYIFFWQPLIQAQKKDAALVPIAKKSIMTQCSC